MRTKLNIADQKYIDSNRDKEPGELATLLDLSIKSIQKYIDDNPVKKAKVKTRFDEALGRKEDRGVVVMTPAASEIADAKRVVGSKKLGNCIHNPKD